MATVVIESGQPLLLCSGTFHPDVSFRDRIGAAAAAGFSYISMWGRDYQRARAEGLSDSDLLLMLGDHGLRVGELDPVWSWLPGTQNFQLPIEHDPSLIFQFDESRMLTMAEALEARSINVVDILGGTWTHQEAVESFKLLCQRAAEHGLLVQLEFLPWSRIPDLSSAWAIVREAEEDNGGLTIDAWHYCRQPAGEHSLGSIPPDQILGIQLCDGPAAPPDNPMHAALHDRLLPGDGEFDLGSLISDLRLSGCEAPIGIEVFSDALHGLPPAEGAQRAGETLRRVLGSETHSGNY
jgi:sugar phosphate isomerase/epimerase